MAHHNPFVECPYNIAHQVPKLRLQQHLLKCRKNYPHLSSTFKTCPFNATHVMPEPELRYHLGACGDRSLIEGQKYCLNTDHGELGNPAFHMLVPKEDWEDEPHQTREEPNFNQSSLNSQPSPGHSSNANLPPTSGFGGLGRGRGLHMLMSKLRNDS